MNTCARINSFMWLSIIFVCCSLVACSGTNGADQECDGVDCGQYGACVEVDGRASCLCDDGYTADGLTCISDPCTSSPCVFGTCQPSGKNAICVCNPGYAGALCDSCAPGYRLEGMTCVEGSPCQEDPCVYGRCRNEGGLPVCDCYTGYTGTVCDACAPGYHPIDLECVSDTPCDPDPCVHGACHAQSGLAVCSCDVGYDGERCELCAVGYHEEGLVCVQNIEGPCDPNPCQEENRQICRVTGADSHECLCNPGYHESGLECVLDSACQPNPCQDENRTVCVTDGEGLFRCQCDLGYHEEGDVCVPDTVCSPNPCDTVHKTICVDDGQGGFSCQCDSGYHDQGDGVCVEDSPCSPNPCLTPNQTVCEVDGQDFICHCDPGYHIESGSCVIDTTCDAQTTCSDHGTCTGVGLECSCSAAYTGDHCELCASGFHESQGECVADSPCEPNPCMTLNKEVCQEQGASFICLCNPGYQDDDGDGACQPDCVTASLDCGPNGSCQIVLGQADCVCDPEYAGTGCVDCAQGYQDNDLDLTCRPDCATAALDCGAQACDDSSGEAICAGVRSCETSVTYVPEAGETYTALYIRGEFNDWGLDDAMLQNPDGSYSVSLELDPGDYAYKLYDQGSQSWFEDSSNPYFKWINGTRNSRLRVFDCEQPVLKLLGPPQVSGGSISFQVQYIDGVLAAGLDPASVQVTRNGAALSGAFEPLTGLYTVDDLGLSSGKHTYRFQVSDNSVPAKSAELLYVPVWVEDSPFAWEDAILYFVMTDRFVDGDLGNNASAGVDYKADWQGGDFAGLLAKIEDGYFDELGVNAIWISSISQNTAGAGWGSDGHMYSGYHSYWPISTGWSDTQQLAGVSPVDPHFGSLEEFKQVVQAAHRRGIRILVDFVANHVHEDSPLWQDHQNSTPAWFHDLYVCGWELPISCWFASYLPDFEYQNLDVMNTVVEHAIWMIQETDIDGFRLDAVKHMIHDFSYALRARIEESVVTSDVRFYMVGETFTGEDGAGLIKEYVRPEELDGQFDFPLYWQVVKTFLRQEQDFRGLESMLQQNEGFYGDWAVMSNFLGNHDVCRALSHANGDISDMWGNGSKEQGWTNPPSLPTQAEPYQRLQLAWTLLMTLPGVPLIYYGDEFGMEGAGDPDNRKLMRFDGLNQYQQDTLAHLKKLTAARNAHPAFRYGVRTELFMDGGGLVWAYGLTEGPDKVVVVFNGLATNETRTIPVSAIGLSEGTQLIDVLSATNYQVAGGAISVTLDGRNSAVLVLD